MTQEQAIKRKNRKTLDLLMFIAVDSSIALVSEFRRMIEIKTCFVGVFLWQSFPNR